MSRLLVLLSVGALVCSVASGGGKRSLPYEAPLAETATVEGITGPRVSEPGWSSMRPTVGTFTTLSGFYDYQANWGAVQQIRVNPANGNIHVTYFTSLDSINPSGDLRSTMYAFSTDGGSSWDNFSNLRIPQRRSGFPTIDIGQGPIAGGAVIANHADPGSGVAALAYIDFPEGSGVFAELVAPPPLGGDDPIWPAIACTQNGCLVMGASRNVASTNHITRTCDYTSWSAYMVFPGTNQGGGTNPTVANGTGRVGNLINTSNGSSGVYWLESTDNGTTWPPMATEIYGLERYADQDTFSAYVQSDVVYNGDTPLMIISEYNVSSGAPDLVFWSQATGFKVAVPFDSTKYFFDPINQRFHAQEMGWPSIGMSGSTIVVVYQGFQQEVDTRNYHYSDLWMVTSGDNGNTWSAPTRITNTPMQDERYPSVSKWNAPGQVNVVWSQKSKSGLYAFPGGADTVRTFQVFERILLTGVEEEGAGLANSFRLDQNYPNPFNPATRIDYTVAIAGPVSIKVYNMLGQEVATIVDQHMSPGTYQATFDGSSLPSGVYVYRMSALATSGTAPFVESRKMILLK